MRYDLAFLGSGISCAQTLLQFIEKLESAPRVAGPLEVAVIEKEGEFWKGIAYGKRSSVNSLIITTLGEFIHPDEKESFMHWLKESRDLWMDAMTKAGGETALQWIEHNKSYMEQDNWDAIYIPRFLYGLYLTGRIQDAITRAEQKGIARVHLIHAHATDITPTTQGAYEISLEDREQKKNSIVAGKVVLSIGSGLNRAVPPPEGSDLFHQPDYLYINDTYYPSLEDHIASIETALKNTPEPASRNILILGSNASSLELLYLIQTRSTLKKQIHKVVVISTSGMLPHRITENSHPDYLFEHLEGLKSASGYNAADLFHTIQKDLDIAFEKGVHIGDMYYQLSDLVVELLKKLSFEQEKEFYGRFGNRFTKLIRRAGAQYRDAAQTLLNEGQMELLKGRFLQLRQSPVRKQEVLLEYTPAGESGTVTHPLSFPIVVNCGGFEDLQESSSPLISNLVAKKLCRVGKTNRGFDVSAKLEASPNLYIMGPLLGGIFNNEVKYWHVENLKRIHDLSKILTRELAMSLA